MLTCLVDILEGGDRRRAMRDGGPERTTESTFFETSSQDGEAATTAIDSTVRTCSDGHLVGAVREGLLELPEKSLSN